MESEWFFGKRIVVFFGFWWVEVVFYWRRRIDYLRGLSEEGIYIRRFFFLDVYGF